MRYDIDLVAGDKGLILPRYKGSTFRGGFGSTFRRLVCSAADQTDCKACTARESCPYALVFESAPPPGSEVLRNLESIPRPFVLEPPLEEKTDYAPGELLTFTLILFGKAAMLLPYFIVTLDEFGRRGIGVGRRSFMVDRIIAVNPLSGQRAIVYSQADRVVRPRELNVTARDVWSCTERELHGSGGATKIRITYLTPTRIHYEGQPTRSPEFHTVIRSLLRRISSLCYFYQGFSYEADFPAIIRRATEVRLVEDETRWFNWERYSSRQDKKVPLGGFTGDATYTGPVGEFLPLLRLGELIHVGKGTVFGQGKFVVKKSTRYCGDPDCRYLAKKF